MNYTYQQYKYDAEERRRRANRQNEVRDANQQDQDYVPRRRRR